MAFCTTALRIHLLIYLYLVFVVSLSAKLSSYNSLTITQSQPFPRVNKIVLGKPHLCKFTGLKIAVNTRLLLQGNLLGIGRYIHETTRRMVLSHPEDEFHFFFDRPFDQQFIYADNVIPHVLSPPSRHPFLWYLWFEWAVPRKLKSIDAEVFYSGDMNLSLKTKVPTVLVSHDLGYEHYPEHIPWLASKYYRHYFPKYHRAASTLITVSESTKKDVIQLYGIPSEKITVATNATPPGFRALNESEKKIIRNKLADGAPYFVFIGSLHPRKNLARLLAAFDLFKEETDAPHKLVIYGPQFFKTDDIFETHQKMKYKADVIFTNDGDYTVPDVLGASTALCFISLFEGFGIPIVEAFAAEVPVITSTISAMPEVAGDAALLVDPQDVSKIKDALCLIYSDDKLCASLIAKGKERKNLFSWDKTAEQVYQALKTSSQLT